MIATWMLYAVAIGVAISLAATAVARAARFLGLPSRLVWVTAMAASVITPAVVYQVRATAPSLAPPAAAAAVGGPVAPGTTGTTAITTPSVTARIAARVTAIAATLDRPLAIGWGLATLLLIGRIASATVRLWRRRHQWIAREVDGVRLYVTPDLGPAVVALPRSHIVVPEWLFSLEPPLVATVLRHEGEHRAAGDARLLAAAALTTAALPWNAALWWQSRQLRLAVELDCDARVLRADPRVDRYGTLLLAIAQHPRAALHPAATLTESSSDLERRIDAMTSTPPSAPRLLAASLVAAAAAMIAMACAMPVPDTIAGPGHSSTASPSATVYTESQVDRPAVVKPGNVSPRYPSQLRTANIEGRVIATFVVDTTGKADVSTFEILKSDHDQFSDAVRQQVPAMSFTAAERGGKPVKQLVRMPFVFSLSHTEKVAKAGLTPDVVRVPVDSHRVKSATDEVVVSPITIIAIRTAPMGDTTATWSPDGKTVPFAVAKDGGRTGAAGRGAVSGLQFAVAKPNGDHAARAVRNQPIPMYPAQLRAANVEGKVIVKFLIKLDGSVDMSTFEVLKSDHDYFTNSVRKALQSMQFEPEVEGGQARASTITMPFIFSLSR